MKLWYVFLIIVGSVAAGSFAKWKWENPNPMSMVRDGRALEQIRQEVDGRRACAILITHAWPIVGSEKSFNVDSVNALIGAGLISRQYFVGPDDRRRRVRLAATKLGAEHMVLKPPPKSLEDGSPKPFLCYGRRKLVSIDTRGVEEPASILSVPSVALIRYRYRVVDMPAWTRRSDIRAAFPFLDRFRSETLESPNAAFLRGRRFSFDFPVEYDSSAVFDTCQIKRRRPPNDPRQETLCRDTE